MAPRGVGSERSLTGPDASVGCPFPQTDATHVDNVGRGNGGRDHPAPSRWPPAVAVRRTPRRRFRWEAARLEGSKHDCGCHVSLATKEAVSLDARAMTWEAAPHRGS